MSRSRSRCSSEPTLRASTALGGHTLVYCKGCDLSGALKPTRLIEKAKMQRCPPGAPLPATQSQSGLVPWSSEAAHLSGSPLGCDRGPHCPRAVRDPSNKVYKPDPSDKACHIAQAHSCTPESTGRPPQDTPTPSPLPPELPPLLACGYFLAGPPPAPIAPRPAETARRLQISVAPRDTDKPRRPVEPSPAESLRLEGYS